MTDKELQENYKNHDPRAPKWAKELMEQFERDQILDYYQEHITYRNG